MATMPPRKESINQSDHGRGPHQESGRHALPHTQAGERIKKIHGVNRTLADGFHALLHTLFPCISTISRIYWREYVGIEPTHDAPNAT